MYLIRKIRDDGSHFDCYHPKKDKAIAILGNSYGLVLDLNKPVGYAGFRIVKCKL